MRSEALDITIENRGSILWLILSGPFHIEQVPNIREKIRGFIDDGNLEIVIDMEDVVEVGDGVIPMFLNALNYIRGKHGDMWFVFKNDVVSKAFFQYKHIFSIYPNEKTLTSRGVIKTMLRRGVQMSRKTGIRLSRSVAIFLLFIIMGWFFTLAFIVYEQNKQIRKQEAEIDALIQWKENAVIEVKNLRNSIKPFKQLGLVKD